MVEIEVKTTQSITNEQLGEYYAKYLIKGDNDGLNQDLAYSIGMNISDNITDFFDVVGAVSALSWDDVAEVLQATAQFLKNSACDEKS